MSAVDGSRVNRTMPELMSWVYFRSTARLADGNQIKRTGSTGSRIDGAMPFATSSLTLRIVCWSVSTLSVNCWPTLLPA